MNVLEWEEIRLLKQNPPTLQQSWTLYNSASRLTTYHTRCLRQFRWGSPLHLGLRQTHAYEAQNTASSLPWMPMGVLSRPRLLQPQDCMPAGRRTHTHPTLLLPYSSSLLFEPVRTTKRSIISLILAQVKHYGILNKTLDMSSNSNGVPSPCISHAPLDSDHWKQKFRRHWWGSSLQISLFSPSIEAVMCKFYQHAPFRPWLRKSLTPCPDGRRRQVGSKLQPNFTQEQ